jgi:hypothetical protein
MAGHDLPMEKWPAVLLRRNRYAICRLDPMLRAGAVMMEMSGRLRR